MSDYLNFFGFLDDGGRDPRKQTPQPTQQHMAVLGKAQEVLLRALGDVPKICPECGELCEEHVVKLRDAITIKLGKLCVAVLQGLEAYHAARKFGILMPDEILQKVYVHASELSVLSAITGGLVFSELDDDDDDDDDDDEVGKGER